MNEYEVKRLKEITNNKTATLKQIYFWDRPEMTDVEIKQVTDTDFIVNGEQVNIDNIASFIITPEDFTDIERVVCTIAKLRENYENQLNNNEFDYGLYSGYNNSIEKVCAEFGVDSYDIEKIIGC